MAIIELSWNAPLFASFPPGFKNFNSFFSSIVTRTSGFNSIDVGSLPAPVLVLLLGMMYISATPVILTVRVTDPRKFIQGLHKLPLEIGKQKSAPPWARARAFLQKILKTFESL